MLFLTFFLFSHEILLTDPLTFHHNLTFPVYLFFGWNFPLGAQIFEFFELTAVVAGSEDSESASLASLRKLKRKELNLLSMVSTGMITECL